MAETPLEELRRLSDEATAGEWRIYHQGARRQIYADFSGRWQGKGPLTTWHQRVAAADPLYNDPAKASEAEANAALIVAAVCIARRLTDPATLEQGKLALHRARFAPPLNPGREPTEPDAGDREYAERLLVSALNAMVGEP